MSKRGNLGASMERTLNNHVQSVAHELCVMNAAQHTTVNLFKTP